MVLNQEIAQRLVDIIISNLGYNVNIMNDLGVIIASGNKERIGTYHKVAEEVIKKKERIDIDEKDEIEYEGVKKGINMPFYYNNSIAGVIGITGSPKEIENTAEMVRMSFELMLDQQALKERVYFHQSQKTFFINQLLAVTDEEEWESTKNWGEKLGYDLNIPRVVCLISIKNIDELVSRNPLFTKEKAKEYIITRLKSSKLHSKQDISSYINVDQIIIFKTFNSHENDMRIYIKDYVDEIVADLKKLKIDFTCAIGNYHKSLFGYKESYKEAKIMIDYSKENNNIIFASDHIFEILFLSINKELIEYYLKPFVDKVSDPSYMVETIGALINNNMNLVNASKELYVHRNTMIFRMNKLKDKLGINPIHNVSDRILLHLIYLYVKYYI
jgi:carbohydrate diacid regulator